MRRFGKWLGRVLVLILLMVLGVAFFGPTEPVDVKAEFDAATLGDDIDSYLTASEKDVPNLREGEEKRVIWAGAANEKTPLSIVYLHGFSAGSEEIRPVPDNVARELGANLFYQRLKGHSRDGTAMAQPNVNDWMQDAAEAMAIGRSIGNEVIVISVSTGGTIAAVMAQDANMSKDLKGIVFISPNFGILNPMARILTWPAVRQWGPVVAGAERSFEPFNDRHAQHWTTRYPTVSVLPMAAIVKYAQEQDFSNITIPALFYYSLQDKVVDPAWTRKIADEWGGVSTIRNVKLPDGSDPYNHVIAGDIMSPDNTLPATRTILDWANGL